MTNRKKAQKAEAAEKAEPTVEAPPHPGTGDNTGEEPHVVRAPDSPENVKRTSVHLRLTLVATLDKDVRPEDWLKGQEIPAEGATPEQVQQLTRIIAEEYEGFPSDLLEDDDATIRVTAERTLQP